MNDLDTMDGLIDMIDVAADPAVRVILLRGNGKSPPRSLSQPRTAAQG